MRPDRGAGPSWLQFIAHAALAAAVYQTLIPDRIVWALGVYVFSAHFARFALLLHDATTPPRRS